MYTSILGSIWKEKKNISILDFFFVKKKILKKEKNKVQNYCLQANIEKQEKDIISNFEKGKREDESNNVMIIFQFIFSLPIYRITSCNIILARK